jgi:hypothetical protein
MCHFYDFTRHTTSMPQFLSHPGRVDLARSTLIDRLRHNPKYDYLHSWDTDVVPHTIRIPEMPDPISLDDIVRWCDEDKALGYDVVVGATLGPSADPMVWTDIRTWTTVERDKPFQIASAAGGFYSMSRECAAGLKVLGELKMADGGTPPFFCFNDGKGGEDTSLFENIRASGFKACCDPRIILGHEKRNVQVMNPAWFSEQRNAAIQALRNRERRLKEEERPDYPVAVADADGPKVLPVSEAVRRD